MIRICSSILAVLFVMAVASCSKTPEHTKYIPKNAMVVVGINTKELSKKIAWDAIIGSKLLDEMKAKMPDESKAAEGLGDAGIDALNTTYFYFSPDGKKDAYHYLTAIVPLSDVKKWETYVQKSFNNPTIKPVEKRKEALLDEELYASWDEKIVIIRKVFISPSYDYTSGDGYSDEYDSLGVRTTPVTPKADPGRLAADMQVAFTVQKENIANDKRFDKLQRDGDDITYWVNYDVLMNSMNALSGGMTGGLALGSNLWKNTVFTAGVNFEKGKVDADMKYYVSDDLKQIYAKIGNKDADKDMIDRLPAQNLDMIMSAHIATDGLKAMMEKMGVLGFVSLALAQSDLTTDDIFQSFTGDMAMIITDFRLDESKRALPSPANSGEDTVYNSYSTPKSYSMNFVYALKINDKQRFDKLLKYVIDQGGLEVLDANTYKLMGSDSLFVNVDPKFVVISNSPVTGKAYIAGSFKSQAKPEIVKKEIYGHPFGFFMDIQAFLNGIVPDNSKSPRDIEMLAETKKLFQHFVIHGGDNKKEVFTFGGSLQLVNKNENSLLQIMDYSMKMKDINDRHDKKEQTSQPPVAAIQQ